MCVFVFGLKVIPLGLVQSEVSHFSHAYIEGNKPAHFWTILVFVKSDFVLLA